MLAEHADRNGLNDRSEHTIGEAAGRAPTSRVLPTNIKIDPACAPTRHGPPTGDDEMVSPKIRSFRAGGIIRTHLARCRARPSGVDDAETSLVNSGRAIPSRRICRAVSRHERRRGRAMPAAHRNLRGCKRRRRQCDAQDQGTSGVSLAGRPGAKPGNPRRRRRPDRSRHPAVRRLDLRQGRARSALRLLASGFSLFRSVAA